MAPFQYGIIEILSDKKIFKEKNTIVAVISALLFGSTRSYSYLYFIYAFLIGLVLAYSYINYKKKSFSILVMECNAEEFAKYQRSHWVLDVAFRGDDSRVRKDNAPENLSVLRHMTLNLLNQEKTHKRGINGKRLLYGWDNDYLFKVIGIDSLT